MGDGTSNNATYLTTLQYALVIAGTELVLASHLNVPLGTLKNWMGGLSDIPDAAFLKAVDVIVAANPADIARSRSIKP